MIAIMKTIINKLRYTLLLGFFALAALGNSLNAATLTVCDANTTTNDRIPFYGWYHDISETTVQMIYPSSMLTVMNDGTITSVKFYTNNGVHFSGGQYTVTIGLTDASSISSLMTISGTTASTTFVPNTNLTEIELTFNPGLTYTPGKNLIIETKLTSTGTCDPSGNHTYFIGVNQDNNCSYGNKGSTGAQRFLPKATFGYEPASSDPTISADPLTIDFDAMPGGSDSKTVTVRGRNLTGNINVSGPSGGIFSVSPSSFTPSNGIVDNEQLTITYTPSEVGTHSAIVTLSSAGADPVYINLNGTCTEDLTICNGTGTNQFLPIYGYYYDNYQKNQMIYPESMVGALTGRSITSMTFYANGNFNFNGGQVTVRLGTTDQTNYTGKVRLQPADMDIVKSGFDVPSGGNTWTIVFDTPFNYNGGNLVVDFEETSHSSGTGHYSSSTFGFYGITQSGGGFCSYGDTYNAYFSSVYSSGTVQNFLPKVTFTSEVNTPITNGTVSPNDVAFGAKNIGGTYTATVTVTNTGNQPFTPVIDVTGLPAGISVSPTTSGQLAAHGTLDLTVTFTPTAETSYSGSFTVTIPVPDGEDIVVTVNVSGLGYYASMLKSNIVEVPVYKSEAKAPSATYVFSQNDVEGDTDMSLSYGENADVKVDVLVKDDEPITSYDLRHKVGSGNWASAATATQDASNPKSYVYNNDTFVIPSDASQMWLSMTDEGADASSTISYVPVTVANGVVTQGNTYGAPQVQASNDPISFIVSVGGSKSAGRPGGHWDQNGVDYCVYTPVVIITNINPTFDGENRTPYLIRAWLLKNDNVPFYSIVRVANENDPDNSHIEAGNVLTYPYPLGEMYLESDMISEQYMIGHDWSGEGDDPWNNPWGDVEDFMENVFAAPSNMPTGEHMKIAVRIYYYKPSENVSGSQMLAANRDSEAPGDGYGYGEGEGNGEGIPTAVAGIYTDRQVVDVKYVNPQGLQSDRPFDGVNIIVTRYNDGSVTTSKVVR